MVYRSLRTVAGALLYDAPRFETHLRGRWERIRNRNERISVDERTGGVRCDWQWSSTLHYCDVFPGAAERLMRRAFRQWPIVERESLQMSSEPQVTFIIGHRGAQRLPLLLASLRTIAGQDVPIECVVVEQAATPAARVVLPSWVRHIHQPVATDEAPYNRAATFNEGARHARGSVLVLHDNDMLVPSAYARELLRHVAGGWQAMDLKRFIFYLDASGKRSEKVVQNPRGGSVAITREGYAAIGGFDERFVGWGGEDNDFWDRAETLRATRFGYLPMIHLWHEPQPRKGTSDAVARYHEVVAAIPPAERIRRLRALHISDSFR